MYSISNYVCLNSHTYIVLTESWLSTIILDQIICQILNNINIMFCVLTIVVSLIFTREIHHSSHHTMKSVSLNLCYYCIRLRYDSVCQNSLEYFSSLNWIWGSAVCSHMITTRQHKFRIHHSVCTIYISIHHYVNNNEWKIDVSETDRFHK